MATYTLAEVMGEPKRTYSVDEVMRPPEAPSIMQQAGAVARDLPKQLGLAARYGLQGLASTAGIVTDPLAYISNRALGTNLQSMRGATEQALTAAGLPQPQTQTERVVGEASELLAGTGGMLGGIPALTRQAPQLAQALAPVTARPGLQASSAIGSGLAGGEAREQGASPLTQGVASLIGGLGVPIGAATIEGGVNKAIGGVKALGNWIVPSIPTASPQALQVIERAGVDLTALSRSARDALAQDVATAMRQNGNLSPDAIRRLAAYRAVNATPRTGNLTLNPVDITQQRNLAKVGAGSTDPRLQQLAQIENQNNAALINQLSALGNANPDQITGARTIMSALQRKTDIAQSNIGQAYQAARETTGRSAALDPSTFTQTASNLLEQNLLGSKLPADVRNRLNAIASGDHPLTVDVAEQLKTNLYQLSKKSSDGQERMALGLVRQALEDTPLLEGQGQTAIDAFNVARAANRKWMQKVEVTPALQAVVDDVAPDRFVQDYIVGSGKNANIMGLYQLKRNLRGDPEALEAVKGQMLRYLKEGAIGKETADEYGKFSSSGYRKALANLGNKKLRIFFSPEEIKQLGNIKEVASAEQFQPVGAAVNNSNSATTLAAFGLNALDWLGNSKLGPFIPGKGIAASLQAGGALNVPKALVQPIPRQPLMPSLTIPGALSLQSGLLLPPEQPGNNY